MMMLSDDDGFVKGKAGQTGPGRGVTRADPPLPPEKAARVEAAQQLIAWADEMADMPDDWTARWLIAQATGARNRAQLENVMLLLGATLLIEGAREARGRRASA